MNTGALVLIAEQNVDLAKQAAERLAAAVRRIEEADRRDAELLEQVRRTHEQMEKQWRKQ